MIESIVNFRDFGGLPSRFGDALVRDRLYRSGAIAAVSNAEIERLLGLDFALVADLRYAGEREDEPSPWPLAMADRILFHDGGRDAEAPHMEPLRRGTMTEPEADRIYEQLYRDMPFDPLYRPLFGRVLNGLAHIDGRALVHCTAGKDRTGVLVALIHHALGVPRDAIIADYMVSATAPGLIAMIEPMAERMTIAFGFPVSHNLMTRLLGVREDYLAAFFDEIERRCGSVDSYLDTLGLDESARDRLRARLIA